MAVPPLARVRLAYGERLRRRRAIAEARVQTHAALEIFERLRGVTVGGLRERGASRDGTSEAAVGRQCPGPSDAPGVADRQPRGIRNDEQGDCGLTAVPFAPHSWRSPPSSVSLKLGVATRAGLRDALASVPRALFPRVQVDDALQNRKGFRGFRARTWWWDVESENGGGHYPRCPAPSSAISPTLSGLRLSD